MAEIVFESEYMTVVCRPEAGIIHHTIHETVPSPVLRAALNAGTEALAHYGATKWLSDDRKNASLSEEDIVFGFTEWAPRTVKAG